MGKIDESDPKRLQIAGKRANLSVVVPIDGIGGVDDFKPSQLEALVQLHERLGVDNPAAALRAVEALIETGEGASKAPSRSDLERELESAWFAISSLTEQLADLYAEREATPEPEQVIRCLSQQLESLYAARRREREEFAFSLRSLESQLAVLVEEKSVRAIERFAA